jgi:hypothetical protein
MKPLVCQRYKNLLRVLMPFWFECKRDLYFSGGKIVESESEEVVGRTSEQSLRAKHGEKQPRDLIGFRLPQEMPALSPRRCRWASADRIPKV